MNYQSPANVLKGAAAVALLLSSCMFASAEKADSKKISDLFAEVKQHASLAEDDAQTLEAYTRSTSTSWEGHANRLRLVREHVSDLLEDYNETASLRDEGSPWQQDAIDQLRPVLKGMADHLTATLQRLRENPSRVQMPPYVGYVHRNAEYVTKASSLIHDLVDYGMAKAMIESLEKERNLRSQVKTE